jgi:hypothetical protein
MNQEIPRRIRIDLFTPEEKALYEMVGKIEELGAHPLLTDCVVLLGEARSKLSDWVDLQAAEHSVQADLPTATLNGKPDPTISTTNDVDLSGTASR